LSAVTHPIEPAATSAASRIEVWFRRAFWLCTVVAMLGVLGHFAILWWAQEEFSAPESIVSIQAAQLAKHGTLYYGLTTYPYTVCAYMPQFYFLEAGLNKIGLPMPQAGRIVSFAAMIGLFVIVWKLVALYTNDRRYAWLSALLIASTSLILSWGTTGQVDTLAIFWAMAAFYHYSRYAVLGERALVWAGVCALIALLTKQTAIACPAAIFVHLLFTRRQTALWFGAIFGGIGGGLVLLINYAMGGRFLLNTVFANMNAFRLDKLEPHLNYIMIAALQLIIIAILGLKSVWRAGKSAPYVYLAFAILVLAATAPKIGSDSNYQIEMTVLLVVCASIALREMNFLQLVFSSSRSWITLLQLPLAVHLVENYRITEHVLLKRIVTEQMLHAQVDTLRPMVQDGGRLLSTDYNVMARLRGEMEVEPLIYTLLVDSKRIDPMPLTADLAAEKFSTILLYNDLDHPEQLDQEVSSLPQAQLDEIRKHYRMIAHVPGPYVNGVFVYKRAGA
jgi:hypothetical protein